MRVIAQDEKVDIPYERMIIQIDFYDNKTIIAYDTTRGAYPLDMAKYSTAEKALEAMKMLRDKYLMRTKVTGNDTLNYYVLPKVFKFPQDDEIKEDKKND